jgi:hypothetical protein
VQIGSGMTWASSGLFLKADGTLWVSGVIPGSSYGNFAIDADRALLATDVIAADIGWGTDLYVKSDGTLWSQPGGQIPGVSGVVAVSVGEYDAVRIYLKNDGTLWQLGCDNSSTLLASDVVTAAAGLSYYACVKSDGTLWGQELHYQDDIINNPHFGDGTAPAQVADHVTSLVAAGWHILFTTSDHTLWGQGHPWGSWGDQYPYYSFQSSPVQVESGIKFADATHLHNIYVKDDDTLWTRGDGWDSWAGPAVEVDSDVVAASATGVYSIYIKRDGTVWARSGTFGTLDSPVQLAAGGLAVRGATDNAGDLFIQQPGIGTAPAITTQPQSAVVPVGSAAILQVSASGSGPLDYQWFKDGVAVPSARAAQYPIPYATATDAGSYSVVITNSAGQVTSASATVTVTVPTTITSISPAEVQAGSGSFVLTVTGDGFVNGATVLWNGAARPTTFVSSTQLTATIPAADIATVTDLQTVSIAVQNPAGSVSNVQTLTVVSAAVTAVQAASAGEGTAVTVSVPPAPPSGGGVTATLANATVGSGPATITVATYGSQPVLNLNNPNPLYFFRIEAGYYDVQIAGVDSSDSVTSYFYWPLNITGDTESDPGFILYYFDGTNFSPVKSSGSVDPAKNTTDDLDGTISGGRFTVVFDTSSTPRLSELTGKVFAIGIKDIRVPATVTLSGLSQTYDGAPEPATATTVPAGLAVTLTYDGSTTAPTNVGSYAVVGTVVDPNYLGTATGTLTIHRAAAMVTLSNLRQSYDGEPKQVTVTTTPLGLAVNVTYNGGATPPVAPGSYAVVAAINNPNYAGSAADTLIIFVTALVRHAPTLNGSIDGSIQVLSGGNFTLNGNLYISGDLLVPGTPTVRLNGHASCGGVHDGDGSALPSGYVITLNGNAIVHRIVQHTDPIALPVVNAPPQPAGTRNVSLNSAGQSAGNFATIRNLTLNGNVGQVAVPAGTYCKASPSTATASCRSSAR